MGHIGDIAVLEPGQSVTLTKDFVVGDEPVINVGTAVGEDILGRVVSDDDDAFVSPIAGENPPNPPDPPGTPFTGSDAGQLGLITMVLARDRHDRGRVDPQAAVGAGGRVAPRRRETGRGPNRDPAPSLFPRGTHSGD